MLIALAILAWPAMMRAQTPARDAPPATGTAVIRGRVVVAGPNRPLSRVEVRATCSTARVNKAVLTDGNGRYEITELPACRYVVGFGRTNYVRANYGQRRPLGAGTPIEVANGQVVTKIDAALLASGVITGRILDEFGDPATNVSVQPMRSQFINGERRLQQAGGGGLTNDLGEYRIYGLAPGQYLVTATIRSQASADNSDATAYAPTYYPGTGNSAEAQRLTVAPGQTISGVNIALMPVAALRVSGVALDIQGRPMAGGNVNLMRRTGGGFISGSMYAQLHQDGTFSLSGVTPGEYVVRVSPSNSQDENASADITVSTSDVTDIQVIVTKPSTLKGRVTFDAGDLRPPPLSAVRVTVSHPNALMAMGGSGEPKDDGTFEIKTAAGHSLVRGGVQGPGNWRLKRVITADGTDITDSGFEILPNTNVDGIVIELTSRYPELTGTVVDAAGAAVHDCIVVAFAQDPSRWAGQTRFVSSSRPDADNVVHLRIPPGDYYAVAFELDDPSVSVADPDILQQLRDRATMVSVSDGEKKTLSLTLSQPPIF